MYAGVEEAGGAAADDWGGIPYAGFGGSGWKDRKRQPRVAEIGITTTNSIFFWPNFQRGNE